MSRFHCLASAASAAALLCIASTAASAEVFCNQNSLSFASFNFYYGYSEQPAAPGSPGTSTITEGGTSTTVFCFDPETGEGGIVGTIATTSENYTDGPGESPYENFNPISSTCEATGTLSCP